MADDAVPVADDSVAGPARVAGVPVQSLQRGIQILDLVAQANKPMRLSAIARELEMDRASAFRLLQTLEQNELVYKDPATKSYSIGTRLMQWTSRPAAMENLIGAVRPFLERLTNSTGESGHFGVLRNNSALLLDYAAAQGTIVVQNRVGVFEPLYCTALGKALLAFLPPLERDRMLSGLSLKPRTETTIVDRAELDRVLDTVRATFIAHDDGEYDPDLYCVAAPIFSRGERPVGAIGVSMVRPIAKGKEGHISMVVGQVRECAVRLTTCLGGALDRARAD